MGKLQKETFTKFPLIQKKIFRLFSNKHVTQEDQFFLNYIYEETQSLKFFYGMCLNSLITIGMVHAFFRQNTIAFRAFIFGASFFTIYLMINKRVNNRFQNLLMPYFEKYEMK